MGVGITAAFLYILHQNKTYRTESFSADGDVFYRVVGIRNKFPKQPIEPGRTKKWSKKKAMKVYKKMLNSNQFDDVQVIEYRDYGDNYFGDSVYADKDGVYEAESFSAPNLKNEVRDTWWWEKGVKCEECGEGTLTRKQYEGVVISCDKCDFTEEGWNETWKGFDAESFGAEDDEGLWVVESEWTTYVCSDPNKIKNTLALNDAFIEVYRPDLGMPENWEEGGMEWLEDWVRDNTLETVAREMGFSVRRVPKDAMISGYERRGLYIMEAESFEAELKKDSCCCGATIENPCLCMKKGVMNCSSVEPKCPCYSAKEGVRLPWKSDAESFEADSKESNVLRQIKEIIHDPSDLNTHEAFERIKYLMEEHGFATESFGADKGDEI